MTSAASTARESIAGTRRRSNMVGAERQFFFGPGIRPAVGLWWLLGPQLWESAGAGGAPGPGASTGASWGAGGAAVLGRRMTVGLALVKAGQGRVAATRVGWQCTSAEHQLGESPAGGAGGMAGLGAAKAHKCGPK